ncbi:universal stress protein [Hymenobacter sp. BRD128]|uniref:universal stress protein n=1 Tax=Hymenobacter sp. BRD128 TaxID=2675878 RepID=UPI001565D9CF|nr:universal stress protein [Hymenobacter sp. BRD128]QKG55177.1 universal stress protein [Hymenobacter sp. BRD128]
MHVLAQPLVALEFGPPLLDTDYVPAVRAGLLEAAARLPVPATVELLEDDNWYSALDQLLAAYQPALLLAGLSATDGPLDEWLSNRALPLAHRTGYPLLLVPEFLAAMYLRPPAAWCWPWRTARLPSRPRGGPGPLLARLSCAVVPVTVLPPTGPQGRRRPAGRAALRASPTLAGSALHRVVDARPAAGIWQATDELEADMLALLDQGHGWIHKLFSGSVIADVLRYSQVPVLLLPSRRSSEWLTCFWRLVDNLSTSRHRAPAFFLYGACIDTARRP